MSDVIHEEWSKAWLNAEASEGKDELKPGACLMTYRIDIGYHIGKIAVYGDPELRDMILEFLQSRTKIGG